MKKRTMAAIAPIATLAGHGARDLLQKDHALRRNFPILARLRYALEAIGPELRQNIVTSNDAERTFADVVPASPIHGQDLPVPSAKALGAPRRRRQAFRPASVVNVSAMSLCTNHGGQAAPPRQG